jgi:hypothetical protein
VRPRLTERVEHVGRGEQAGRRVQLGAADAGGVPGPVHTLVVAARYQSQRAEHRRPCQDPASVVRVQAHLFPFLSPQRTGLLPHTGRHRDPAEVVHQAGPVGGCRIRRRCLYGRRARQRGDPSRVAGEPRALQIGGIPEPGQGIVEGRLVAERAPRCGLGVDRGRPQVVRAGDRQQFARRVGEDRRDLRIQRASGPASHGPGRDITAADGVEHNGRVADRGEPRRLGDLRTSPARRDAVAVETLEAVQDGVPDCLRQPQTSRQVRADLTVGPRPFSLQPSDACRAAQRPQARGVDAQTCQELQCLAWLGRIDQVTTGADHDVIAAEHSGDLMRRRGAAGEPHQGAVVDLALTTLIEPRPPGQLRRQQARARCLARRVPASQVAHHRQCRNHTRHADRLPHSHKSKDQQTASPLNRQRSLEDPGLAVAPIRSRPGPELPARPRTAGTRRPPGGSSPPARRCWRPSRCG